VGTLPQNVVVQGMNCAKKYIVYFGSLRKKFLAMSLDSS